MIITPYSKNAKKHPKKQVKQIAASIQQFGMNQPIVVDGNGVIIVGHGRYEALKFLEWSDSEIAKYVKIIDLNEEQAKAYRLADNKLNESDWDMVLVIEELKGLSVPMFDLTGFSRDLILEMSDRDDAVPEIPDLPKTVPGDLYELGKHRVLCADSTKVEDVERLMAGMKADLVFTDPPYNVAYVGKTKEKLTIKNDNIGEFGVFCASFIKNIMSFCRGAIYICMSSSEWPTIQFEFTKWGGALVEMHYLGQGSNGFVSR